MIRQWLYSRKDMIFLMREDFLWDGGSVQSPVSEQYKLSFDFTLGITFQNSKCMYESCKSVFSRHYSATVNTLARTVASLQTRAFHWFYVTTCYNERDMTYSSRLKHWVKLVLKPYISKLINVAYIAYVLFKSKIRKFCMLKNHFFSIFCDWDTR